MDEYFGSVSKSMFTFFQIMTTEGWADIARVTVQLDPEMENRDISSPVTELHFERELPSWLAS